MIGGQVIDLLSEDGEPDDELLRRIDRLKTGALIQASVRLGCIAAGVTDEKILKPPMFTHKASGLLSKLWMIF